MRIATIEWRGGTSAAVVMDGAVAAVRALSGRETAHDAMALISAPLTEAELELLARVETAPLADAVLRAPILNPPKNVLCVGKNYIEHVREGARAEGSTNLSAPRVPVWFTKPSTALVGSGGDILHDASFTSALDYEGELALVIGTGGKSIPAEEVSGHIFGYTILNDVTARDVQQAHLQWFRGKSADTYAPCGPWIVTADELPDPGGLTLTTTVNGVVRQHDNTRNLLFDIATLVSDISQGLTLMPGDIIATGTPSGVAWGMDDPAYLVPGDVVEVEIEGIGTLTNRVVSAP
jgi:2-keto-4-pentenoate hydratase/2-oxohepta-3-ene-1,7-dioic acid hydratase in catechol pathway